MGLGNIRRMSDTDIETVHSISWKALGTGMENPLALPAIAEYTRSIAASNLIIIELMIRNQEMVIKNQEKGGKRNDNRRKNTGNF
jgi:hypothetical protein